MRMTQKSCDHWLELENGDRARFLVTEKGEEFLVGYETAAFRRKESGGGSWVRETIASASK